MSSHLSMRTGGLEQGHGVAETCMGSRRLSVAVVRDRRGEEFGKIS
jgi:hypothetical protein